MNEWNSAGGRTVNQIDKVLISNRFRSAITDIRALRGPDFESDHNLLKIKKYNEKRKIVNIFQNLKCKQEYSMELNNRVEISENMEDEDNIDNNINEK